MSTPSRHDRHGVKRRRMRGDAPAQTTGKLVSPDQRFRAVCAYCGFTIIWNSKENVWVDPTHDDTTTPERCLDYGHESPDGHHAPGSLQRKAKRRILGTLTREEYEQRNPKPSDDWHARYVEQDVHGKTVYICTQCDKPVSKASRKLHAENHAREE